MPAPLSTRNGYIWVNVTVSYGGIYLACNSVAFARDSEDQFVQTTDVHGTAVHSYMSNMSGTFTLEIPMTQKVAIDTLGTFPSAVDAARRAGGNPGIANPLVPFLLLDPSSGSTLSSALARVAGHPSDITFDETGEKMRTFKILATNVQVITQGYLAG